MKKLILVALALALMAGVTITAICVPEDRY